jgi:hypothetical protein
MNSDVDSIGSILVQLVGMRMFATTFLVYIELLWLRMCGLQHSTIGSLRAYVTNESQLLIPAAHHTASTGGG